MPSSRVIADVVSYLQEESRSQDLQLRVFAVENIDAQADHPVLTCYELYRRIEAIAAKRRSVSELYLRYPGNFKPI